MTIEEKTGKTLAELGVTDEAGVKALFADVRATMEGEWQNEISRAAVNGIERGSILRALRDRWLSRKSGLIARIDERWLRAAPKNLKPVVGQAFNDQGFRIWVRKFEAESLADDVHRIAQAGAELRHETGQRDDLTLPGYQRPLGSIHPVTRVQREIEDIFLGLGFSIETGPEIESVYYNFDALNIPESHPARDDWDTIYVDPQTVLRTHTSPVQMRAMERHGAPLYVIAPGKCYRRDNPDSTHSPMFHQIEGLAVDTDITFADLKGTLDFFAKKFLGERVRTRFNPSFFPFTEPSGEMSASCPFCDGRGCRHCKESGWIELLGCGMVHPQVLRNGGIDPERYSGWAFGLGVDRFAMVKYDVNDIQLFFQGDVRFLEQF